MTPNSNSSSEKLGIVFLLSVIIIFVAKIWLIGANEIIAVPNDSVNYVRQAHLYLSEIGGPMGYSYWLAVTEYIGLPQRIAIEVLYLFGALLAATQLRYIAGKGMALLTFFLLAFLPATFFLFDNALSDGFYGCLTLIAITLSIGILTAPKFNRVGFWFRVFFLALIFGWMLITRNEDYFIVAWMIWLTLCRLVIQIRHYTFKSMLLEVMTIFGALIIGSFAIAEGVATFHWVTKDVYARTLPTLPSHMELLNNLASIDTGATPIIRVPISSAAREMAYGVSPSLRRLRTNIENPENMYQLASARSGLPNGEIGAGWIWHVFNDGSLRILSQKKLKDLDSFYHSANSEIESAFENGLLKKRFVLHPLLGGSLIDIFIKLPVELLKVYWSSFQSTTYVADQGFESELFDAACLRRTALVHVPGYGGLVQGWAFPDFMGTPIISAFIGVFEKTKGIEHAKWFEAKRIHRADVEHAFSAEGRDRIDIYGFRTQIPFLKIDQIVMKYFISDGTSAMSPVVEVNRVSRIKLDNSSKFLVQGIDTAGEIEQSRPVDQRITFQSWLITQFSHIAPYLFIAFIGIAIALNITLKLQKLPASMDGGILYSLILVSGIVLLRLLFYAIVDTAAWDIEIRYLASAAVVIVIAFILLVTHVFGVGKVLSINLKSRL